MKLTQDFVVEQPIETVWRFFDDIPAVADCLPGARLEEVTDDGACRGTVTVKLGPMSPSFEGEAQVERDDAGHGGTIRGRGRDRRGGSRAQVRVAYRLEEVAEPSASTRVVVDADIELSGAAAQFGRTGLIEETANRLAQQFVTCLESKLSAPSAEAAGAVRAREVNGVGLLLASLWARIRRLLGNVAQRARRR